MLALGLFDERRQFRIGREPQRDDLRVVEPGHGRLLLWREDGCAPHTHLEFDDAVLQPRRVVAADEQQHEDRTNQPEQTDSPHQVATDAVAPESKTDDADNEKKRANACQYGGMPMRRVGLCGHEVEYATSRTPGRVMKRISQAERRNRVIKSARSAGIGASKRSASP